ncbi:MAG: alanine racemase [Acidimicrobiales bacterium]|nr:alanine racemase [Acidimicrobiales bacterium]
MDLPDPALLSTPALLLDVEAFDHNLATMAAALPGPRCRPHVKAFKSTAVAGALRNAGHGTFCTATVRELIGMAQAGFTEDLLLANECLDPRRLAALAATAEQTGATITVAVDSEATVDAAAAAGLRHVLIDVNVGLARCGCDPTDAGWLAERARGGGLEVRGVMGYEGHLMGNPDRSVRSDGLEVSMAALLEAHRAVGGEVISGGGTGTYDLNRWVTEIQAGSYTMMDTAYAQLGLPFRQALAVAATVISTGTRNGRRYFVADCGLKALGMDHGPPDVELADGSAAKVWFCSDEHVTFSLPDDAGDGAAPALGALVAVRPAHVDPTVAYHERYVVVRGGAIVDEWRIDLRGW